MREVTGKTRVLMVLADPVAHVRGTAFLNAHFQSEGINAAIVPLNVRPADLPQILDAVRAMHNVAGVGVTVPHKIAVIDHLDALAPRAEAIGAVNTVRRAADGRLTGDNVDGIGFVNGLRAAGLSPEGMRIAQVGAGGAGRAIAFALAEAGAQSIAIANRTADKAETLAAAVRSVRPNCAVKSGTDPTADLVVNTTTLGLGPDDPLPAEPSDYGTHTAFADVIMSPTETAMLVAARGLGRRTVLGREMLFGQMKAACEVWQLAADDALAATA
ncbi:MAG: shikimate dehydrogenase [Devosia sp.]